MRTKNCLSHLFLSFCLSLACSAPARALPVYLPEDEFTLPPLLYRIETVGSGPNQGLNVLGVDKKKRRSQKEEWLRYGDELDFPARIAIEVIQSEEVKWIGGGVFQAKVGLRAHAKDDSTYELSLNRGWMRVWVKPGKLETPEIQIHTKQGLFVAKEAEFWISSRPEQTEIYLVQGHLERSENHFPITNHQYAIFERSAEVPRYVAKDWDMNAVEVKLSSSYPALGRLVAKAGPEWNSGKSAAIYHDYRRKGWRKADPMDPHSRISK